MSGSTLKQLRKQNGKAIFALFMCLKLNQSDGCTHSDPRILFLIKNESKRLTEPCKIPICSGTRSKDNSEIISIEVHKNTKVGADLSSEVVP